MIVQTIEISLSKGRAPELLAHLGESNRQIEMIPDVTLPETAGAEVNIVKPDATFVIQAAEITDGHIIVTLPDQACTVKGLSHYILKITDTGTVIYSAYGNIFVDDHLITDDLIESVAEVNGYAFPDDFLTYDKLEANPSGSATDTIYRLKIFDTIYGLSGGSGGADVEANPTETPTGTLDALRVDDGIYEVEKPIPVEANPSGSATDTLEKIKIGNTIYECNASDVYSTQEREIGKWIDGRPLYQKTLHFTTTSSANTYTQVPYNIENVDTIFIYDGFVQSSFITAILSGYNGIPAANEVIVLLNNSDSTFDYKCGSSMINSDAYITLRYTKTTDTV